MIELTVAHYGAALVQHFAQAWQTTATAADEDFFAPDVLQTWQLQQFITVHRPVAGRNCHTLRCSGLSGFTSHSKIFHADRQLRPEITQPRKGLAHGVLADENHFV